jgi:hypothetical protein
MTIYKKQQCFHSVAIVFKEIEIEPAAPSQLHSSPVSLSDARKALVIEEFAKTKATEGAKRLEVGRKLLAATQPGSAKEVSEPSPSPATVTSKLTS